MNRDRRTWNQESNEEHERGTWNLEPGTTRYNRRVLLFEFFPMILAIVMVVVTIGLYVANHRTPYDPAEAEERTRRATERRERTKHKPRETGGSSRPSMSS